MSTFCLVIRIHYSNFRLNPEFLDFGSYLSEHFLIQIALNQPNAEETPCCFGMRFLCIPHRAFNSYLNQFEAIDQFYRIFFLDFSCLGSNFMLIWSVKLLVVKFYSSARLNCFKILKSKHRTINESNSLSLLVLWFLHLSVKQLFTRLSSLKQFYIYLKLQLGILLPIKMTIADYLCLGSWLFITTNDR